MLHKTLDSCDPDLRKICHARSMLGLEGHKLNIQKKGH